LKISSAPFFNLSVTPERASSTTGKEESQWKAIEDDEELTVLVLQEVGADDFVVHHDTAVVLDRGHAPHEEDALEKPVEGNHLCDEGCEDHLEVEQTMRICVSS
jgi:hypothetical protein